MSELAALLDRPDALSWRLKAKLIEPTALQRAVAKMPGMGGSLLDAEQTGALQKRLHRAVEEGRVDSIRPRDLREGCKVFLQGPQPLIDNPKTADAIMQKVEKKGQRSAVLALVTSYIDGFCLSEQLINFAIRLRQLLSRWKGPPISPWPELDKAIGLFDPATAPTKLAAAVLGGDRRPTDILAAMGLDTTIRQRGGLAEAAFGEATRIVASKKGEAAIPLQDRILEWLRDNDGQVLFPKQFPGLAASLLVPWASSEPPANHRAKLLDVLQGLGGGDPRVKPGGWRAVRDGAPDAYAILMRWLTAGSVFQFFDIIDRSLAHDPAARTMWAYRRSFWTSYLNGEEGAPQIEEAWGVFGDDGARLARQLARESREAQFAFGTQEDKGAMHAALIVKIGDLLIVDWSHNAKCNFWNIGDRARPELYRIQYRAGDLYSAKEQYSHVAPSSYSWQKTFAGIIEGRRFFSERKSWRPKRV